MFEKRLPLDRVHSLEQNKYVLITDGTELALRCAGRSEQIAVIKAGVFEITLQPPCSLHSQTWKLLPIYQRTINLTLAQKDIRFEINVSIADLFQEHRGVQAVAHSHPGANRGRKSATNVRVICTIGAKKFIKCEKKNK